MPDVPKTVYELPESVTKAVTSRWGEVTVHMSDDMEVYMNFDPTESETDEDFFTEGGFSIKFTADNLQTLIDQLPQIVSSAIEESTQKVETGLTVQKRIYDKLKELGFEMEASSEISEDFHQYFDEG